MTRAITLLIAALCLLLQSVAAHAVDTAIGLDVSASHALVESGPYPARVGQDAAGYVNKMKKGDTLRIETFGTHGVSGLAVTAPLNFKLPPNAAAAQVKTLITSLPKQVDEGNWPLSQQTEIAGWITETAKRMQCDKRKGVIVLYTDSVQWSNTVNGQALAEGKAKLPIYSKHYSKCEVHVRGAGYFSGGKGAPYDVVQNLVKAWEDWIKASNYAPASSVSGSF